MNRLRAVARRIGLGAALATARRARLVDRPTRFFLREVVGAAGARCYRLRASNVRICIRHRSPDVYALDQALREGHFDFTEPVLNALRRREGRVRVLDLGANIGLFGLVVLERFPDAEVVAFEPDPSNAAVLRAVVEANGREGAWQIVEACAAARDGTVPFELGGFGISRVAENGGNVPEMPAKDVLPHIAEADLVKIDIEGAEWEILEDSRFAGAPALALHVEYHGRLGAGDDPEARARGVLESAGYSVVSFRRLGEHEGILWAWREP